MSTTKVKRRVGKYELGRTIGEGTFAKVRFAKDTETGEPVAIKIIDKEKVLKHKMVEQVTFDYTLNYCCIFQYLVIFHISKIVAPSFRICPPFSVFTFEWFMSLATLFSIELIPSCGSNLLLMKKLHGRMQIKREISTMKLIKHPNVVRIYEVPFLIFYLTLQDVRKEPSQ